MSHPSVQIGEAHKVRAAGWFAALRDRICAAFEALEDAQDSGPFAALPAGRFERTRDPPQRCGSGGCAAAG